MPEFSFSEVAPALERSEAACRQLAARARARVRTVRPRGATAPPARSGAIDAKRAQLLIRVHGGNSRRVISML